MSAGAAITHEFIANTRRGAQFSSGSENLIRRDGMTSDFLKIILIFRIEFAFSITRLYFRPE
jgi:hypothetical protein